MNEDDPDEASRDAVDDVAPSRGRRQPELLRVRVELVVVDGDAGRELRVDDGKPWLSATRCVGSRKIHPQKLVAGDDPDRRFAQRRGL